MVETPRADAAARLSPRQKECLRLAFTRLTSKEIAAALGLSVGTVNTYITEAIGVLGARKRRHAADLLHAFEAGEPAPVKVELQSEGVTPPRPSTAISEPSSGDWRRVLPVRPKGVIGLEIKQQSVSKILSDKRPIEESTRSFTTIFILDGLAGMKEVFFELAVAYASLSYVA